MRETAQRTQQRDMNPSSMGRALEIFFGGNTDVDAAVLFDAIGETIDYHSYIDPFKARLMAAHSGILFELARYKMAWLEMGSLEMIEISGTGSDIVTAMVCEEYLLVVMVRHGAVDSALLDAITGSVEVLRKEIGC